MTRVRSWLPVCVLIALALLWAVRSATPPIAVAANAPAGSFSAARAMATVRLVARAPHPTGSAEAAAVRARLTRRMREVGLTVSTLRGVGGGGSAKRRDRSVGAGRVDTLLGVLPGRDRSAPAVAIMTHTDSVPQSSGAADDGVGVAVALETARAIAAGGRPARDVLLILTDGEEAGLIGARAFFADPARARRIGALINIDSRGTSGLGTMFETGPASGGLLSLYRAEATNRFAHSAATFLYERLPNNTDLSAARGRDIPALNFAFLDGEFDYHTPRDQPASVDPRTVQSLGDQILPVVRAVAMREALPPRGSDGVFADMPGLVAVRYPAWIGWLLLAAATALAGWGARSVRVGGAARAAAAVLAAGAAAMLAARLGYALTGVGDDWGERHRITAVFTRYEAAMGLAALASVLAFARGAYASRVTTVTIIVGMGLLALLLGRPVPSTAILTFAAAALSYAAADVRARTAQELRTGALAIGLLISTALQLLAPALTPLILWAALAAAGGAALADTPAGRWWAAALALFPLAYLLAFAHAVMLALGAPTPEVVGVFALVAAILLLPAIEADGRLPALVLAGLAALLLLSVRWTTPTERHPLLSHVHDVVDESGDGWRMSPLERPDPWTWSVLKATGRPIERARMPLLSPAPVWRTRAAAAEARPPTLRLRRAGPDVRLTLTPARAGIEMRMMLNVDRPLGQVSVEGVALPGFADAKGPWRLRWQSAGEPVTLRFRARPGTRLRVTAAEYGPQAAPLPPRPGTIVPWLTSDRTVAMAQRGWILR